MGRPDKPPCHRAGQDGSKLARFLAARESSFTIGECILVDVGSTTRNPAEATGHNILIQIQNLRTSRRLANNP